MTSTHTVGPQQGERADFAGLGNRLVLRGDRTGGQLALVEHTLAPRALGAPLHTHQREDEYSFVLAGRIGAQIGDDVVEAGAGELLLKPRGVAHAFWNAGDDEARLLEIISPAGFEQYFADAAAALSGGEPDVAAIAALQTRYGLTMDLASIGPLAERHGLRLERQP